MITVVSLSFNMQKTSQPRLVWADALWCTGLGQRVVSIAKQWENRGRFCDDATRRALRRTGVPSARNLNMFSKASRIYKIKRSQRPIEVIIICNNINHTNCSDTYITSSKFACLCPVFLIVCSAYRLHAEDTLVCSFRSVSTHMF